MKSRKFVETALGENFSLARCNEGKVYIWGKVIGLEKQDLKEPTMVPVPNDKRIVHVSAGSRHAALIDEDGLVYTWGHGGSWLRGGGKLGHGDPETQVKPK